MFLLPLFLTLLGAFETTSAAKIVLVPPQLGSHIWEQIVIGEGLVARGHEVYIVLGSPFPFLDKIKRRGLRPIVYQRQGTIMYGVSAAFDNHISELIMNEEDDKLAISYRAVAPLSYHDCSCMMEDKTFLKAMRNISLDLAVVEAFLPASCYFILPKYIGVPFVSTALLYKPWHHRFPALPSFVPLLLTWIDASDITFFSRFQNLLNYAMIDAIFEGLAPVDNTLLRKYSPEIGTWSELLHRSEFFFASTDHHLVSAVPQMPNYISIAGVTASKAKALPGELEDEFRAAKDGVIVMSFGTIAHYFPAKVVSKFFEAFSRCNQTVLARLNIPSGVTVPKNVRAMSWLHQNDLLGQNNTRLFLTHCGNGGLHEALYHGVPMIGFPLFAEQHFNCERMQRKGLGLLMDIRRFTSEELFEAIQEVLTNTKYRSAIEYHSERFRDQPEHPLDRAVFWIEHVVKYGGKHLHPWSMDLPMYQFLMLDVVAVLVFAASTILYILFRLAKSIRKSFPAWSAYQNKLKSD